ncbi:MAG TPA: hypothetical protein PLE42_02390 [Candidatus Competibacteraceae bacterium]|jgi:hypothetical protein|nr:hypothetical protein [Candidatus Competibacteraceae bacterium]
MGMQINMGDHVSPQAGYAAIPNEYLGSMRWARTKARWIASNIQSANAFFRTLPDGRSLTDLLDDSSIWINYHATMPYYGETNRVSGKEIAISRMAFRIGRWTVLATLVHELAHADGAPGGADKQAERAVLACKLGKQSELDTGIDDPYTPFNPNISG